jgi:hypothetical protein
MRAGLAVVVTELAALDYALTVIEPGFTVVTEERADRYKGT